MIMPSKNDVRYKVIGGIDRARARYCMIRNRITNTHTRKNAGYFGVKLLVEKEEFIKWFMPLDFSGCSVDRIDKKGNYELSNMQVISLSENIAKDKLIAKDGFCRCYSCKQEKPIEQFVADKRRMTTGRSTCCKECDSRREKNESAEARERRRVREAENYQKRKQGSSGK